MKLGWPVSDDDGGLNSFLAYVGYRQDVDSNVLRNYNPAATESLPEGVMIPPVRLMARGKIQRIHRGPAGTTGTTICLAPGMLAVTEPYGNMLLCGGAARRQAAVRPAEAVK